MKAAASGHNGDSPTGVTSMNVIARLPTLVAAAPPAIAATREAANSVEPMRSADDPIAPSVTRDDRVIPPGSHLTVARLVDVPPRPQAKASNSFPLRSVFALVVLAAVSWTAAWWGDRQRLLAEKVLEASHEQATSDSRPERLARELPSGVVVRESVKP